MARLVAPDKGVREVGMTTNSSKTLYKPDRGGIYNVENARHAAQMKAEGFFEASLMGPTTDNSVGFLCSECGFNGWFRKCGRCGHESNAVPRDGE